MRWVRLQLSEGSFVRLVETVPDALEAAPHAPLPASQSAMAVIESNCR